MPCIVNGGTEMEWAIFFIEVDCGTELVSSFGLWSLLVCLASRGLQLFGRTGCPLPFSSQCLGSRLGDCIASEQINLSTLDIILTFILFLLFVLILCFLFQTSDKTII